MKIIVACSYGKEVWNINKTARKEIKAIAEQFGVSECEFLTRFSTHNLPGQISGADSLEGCAMPQGFAVRLGNDEELARRITRAAANDGRSVEEFVWSAVASWIDCSEEPMILHPISGAVIGDKTGLEPYRTRYPNKR